MLEAFRLVRLIFESAILGQLQLGELLNHLDILYEYILSYYSLFDLLIFWFHVFWVVHKIGCSILLYIFGLMHTYFS